MTYFGHSLEDWGLESSSDAEDTGLRAHNFCEEVPPSDVSNAADLEGASFVVFFRESAFSLLCDQGSEIGINIKNALLLNVSDDREAQSMLPSDRDSDVVVSLLNELVDVTAVVELWVHH